MLLKDLAKQNHDYIIDRRRFYHRHPELSRHEVETTKSIIKDLKAMGIEKVETFANGAQGCVGYIQGTKPGKTVMLRADIDALPVKEATGLEFASENPGCMHACGHDNHIAMQLGAAKILQSIKDKFSGTVKVLFQPSEETAWGAKELTSQGVCDGVDAMYGVHIWSTLDAPKVDMQYGERMCSADIFYIDITGKTINPDNPLEGNDVVVAASAVIMGLQTVVSRLKDPSATSVVTVGTSETKVNGATTTISMTGTTRTFRKDVREKFAAQMNKLITEIAEAYGCQGKLKYEYMTGPIVNDEHGLVDIARNAVVENYGEAGLGNQEKVTGAEDYCYYMEKCPAIFGFVGARSKDVPGSEMSNHHQCFNPDERTLERGACVAAQFAFDFLTK